MSMSSEKDKSPTTTAKSTTPGSGGGGGGGGSTGTAEFEPPLACVRRLLKTSLSSSTNVGKDASSAFARACGIFVIYLTACANDFAREGKRQTITANDVLAAVKELDFEEFLPQLTSFLEQHRAEEKIKRKAKEAAKAAREEQEAEAEEAGEKEESGHISEEQPAKKRKLSETSVGDTAAASAVEEEDDDDGDAASEGNDDEDGTHNDDGDGDHRRTSQDQGSGDADPSDVDDMEE